MCFQDSSTSTRSLAGSLNAAAAILVGWCVWTCWEKRKEEPLIPPFADEEENEVVDDSLWIGNAVALTDPESVNADYLLTAFK